ncbi:hypothetical protein EDD21DRAFT_371164 [Dissophora ornata]|nr:hypothetical protein BGZ58_009044 [Dissophora ornata]KAI8602675.1 hypothetical protein EDD21DRAFT_371164 [Dissophora ornata]
MMHRAARSLTINTSNACLVNKFNSSSSSTSSSALSSGGRPYTPTPPSCRLHKIYEEKLDVLGSLGYENWFDDHANPFYRHAEPDLIGRRTLVRKHSNNKNHTHHHHNHNKDKDLRNNVAGKAAAPIIQTPSGLVDTVFESVPSNSTCMNPFQNTTTTTTKGNNVKTGDLKVKDKITITESCTSFESPLDSDDSSSGPDDDTIDYFGTGTGADEIRSLFFAAGYRDPLSNDSKDDEAIRVQGLCKPKSEVEYRRLSNRNRIMDRGHLMPDTTTFLPLPIPREPRFMLGNNNQTTTTTASAAASGSGAKVRALSPYPHSRAMMLMQQNQPVAIETTN